jgi:glycosylphosphatidylinositol transamidase
MALLSFVSSYFLCVCIIWHYEFIHAFVFACNPMTCRRQPHASALHHGIDSLTIQVNIPNRKGKDASSSSSSSSLSIHPHYADLTRCLEHLIRSISNLHERLHHSVSQYLLPSPTKFVSHGEYIYPGVLISLPMVIRAATLALRDVKRFQVKFVGNVLAGVALATLGVGIYAMNSPRSFRDDAEYSLHELLMNSIYLLSYVFVIFVATMTRDHLQKCSTIRKVANDNNELSEYEECRKSLRFIVCLLGVYLHAPLLLANYSLGLPSAVFWSPLLGIFVLSPSARAFLSKKTIISQLLKVGGGMFLVSTSPPILLVPRIFPFYTIYVIAVYTPLHLLLMLLWMI